MGAHGTNGSAVPQPVVKLTVYSEHSHGNLASIRIAQIGHKGTKHTNRQSRLNFSAAPRGSNAPILGLFPRLQKLIDCRFENPSVSAGDVFRPTER